MDVKLMLILVRIQQLQYKRLQLISQPRINTSEFPHYIWWIFQLTQILYTKSLELHIGYARSQNQNSCFDNKANNYLALFKKGLKDGADRDDRDLNVVIALDISGSMNSSLARQNQQTRLDLAKQAILMFFSKLRKTDTFGLLIFNNEAMVKIPLQKTLSTLVREINTSGGTTLVTGLELENAQLNQYLSENMRKKSYCSENRIVMLTDDNSVKDCQKFIQKVSQLWIHTTIVGISYNFRSQVCQQLIGVKGFNYLCATEVDDLQRYLFRNFDFTFFPSNYDSEIKIISDNIASIEVYGTPDEQKVKTYNREAKNSFIITKNKTSFPSQLQISQKGQVKTFGGLVLVKSKLKNNEITTFNSTIAKIQKF